MDPRQSTEAERRVLFVPPTRRDGEVTCALLAKGGLTCTISPDLESLSDEIDAGVGAILLAEETLAGRGIGRLVGALQAQPSWSQIPVVLLVQGASRSGVGANVVEALGNVTLLERPAPTRSVLSAVLAAVRGRERQYQIRDQIDEIRRADAVLRESRERFEALANSIPQLAWMADSNGDISWYNQRWHDYCGTKQGEMEGWGWQAVHDPAELPRVVEKWQRSLASGEPWEDSFPLRRHDGQFRWHLSRAMPFRDASGKILFWFGTNTDITEERQLAENRRLLLETERAARVEAERVSRMKDEFLATLSHELRTPLNAIFGWTQLLMMDPQDEARLREGIAVIDRNVRIQIQLIEDLLDVSRIISGKVRLDVQSIDVTEILLATLETVRPAAQAKQIRLEKSFDPHAGPISGDGDRLQQVFWNLLTNAIKFTPKDGSIQVQTKRINAHVEVTVRDSGEGIDPEFLPRLFDRFSQADGSSRRKHGGLGLGLSIVKNLVELHGGTVEAQSKGEGHGATFVVRLPLRIANTLRCDPASGSGATAPFGHDEINLNGLKVLVVDDEPDARELVRRFVTGRGAVAEVAASAAEAQSLLKTFCPDVIVSDLGMPDTDGYDFIREARTQGCKTPAIALTAFARAEDRLRSIQAGYQSHLPKPVEAAELLAVVASLAGRFDRSLGN